MPDRNVLFGVGMGAWNGADAVTAAESVKLITHPAEVATVYNFGGRITPEPLAATRGEDGRWIGGSVRQSVDVTTAVLEHRANGFIYRSTDDTPAAGALARWGTGVVPAVRDAIAK